MRVLTAPSFACHAVTAPNVQRAADHLRCTCPQTEHAARELFLSFSSDTRLEREVIVRGCTVLDDREFASSSVEGDDVFLCRYCYNELRQASACCKIWHDRHDCRWRASMLNNDVEFGRLAAVRPTRTQDKHLKHEPLLSESRLVD